MKDKIEKILNEQVEKEFFSSNLYMSMACWAESKGFEGVAQWLYAQTAEEYMHMQKIVKYINERGSKAIIPALKQPESEFGDIKKLFKEVLKHEEFITESINNIAGLCMDERDFTTYSWIQWFVNEQVQEEKSVRAILDKLNMLGDNNLYLFDKDIISMRGAETADPNSQV